MRSLTKTFVVFLFSPFLIHAQNKDTTKTGVIHVKKPVVSRIGDSSQQTFLTNSRPKMNFVSCSAQFPSGEEGLIKYLEANIKYPAAARDNKIEGKVYVTFIIDKNGDVKQPIVLKDASKREGTQYNIYELDTVKRNWVYHGKDFVKQLSSDSLNGEMKDSISYASSDTLKIANPIVQKMMKEVSLARKEIAVTEKAKPVEPKKAGSNRPRFTIEVDPKEFPELSIYKNVLFEVGAENKNFDPESYKITWENVKLEEHVKGTSYRLTLSQEKLGKRIISYIVYPVFEGKDYDQAIKEYREKFCGYQKTLAARKEEEKRKEEELAAQMKKYEEEKKAYAEKTERENAELAKQQKQELEQRKEEEKRREEERVTQIKKFNELKKAYTEEVQREQAEIQKQQKQEAAIGYMAVRREFSISNFGIWNTDCPHTFSSAPFQAWFKDEQGNDLQIQQAYLIDKNKNLFCANYSPFSNFAYDANSENVLFVVLPDFRIAVFPSDQFKKINPVNGSYIFDMKIAPGEFKSAAEIKRYLNV